MEISVIMAGVSRKTRLEIKFVTYRNAGISLYRPLAVTERRLMGVGYDGDDKLLHFYVVDDDKGNGFGIAGKLDAVTNTVKKCHCTGLLIRQEQDGSPASCGRSWAFAGRSGDEQGASACARINELSRKYGLL